MYGQCTKKGAGNDKQGKDAGNRMLCPYRNFSQAINVRIAQFVNSSCEQDSIHGLLLAFFQEFFQGAKSVVMQISFVMIIFLLFLDQISGEGKSLRGGQTASGGASSALPVEESQITSACGLRVINDN